MKATNQKLISFHIVEQNNRTNTIRWTYPTITEDLSKYITSNCFTTKSVTDRDEFFCARKNNWIYTLEKIVKDDKFAIVVISSEFEPDKYKSLCDILATKYSKSGGNPVDLVKLYLNIFTAGACSFQDNGSQFTCDFTNYKSPPVNIKAFIGRFNLEVVIIFVALLIKRRILLWGTTRHLVLRDLLCVTDLLQIDQDSINPHVDNPKDLKGFSFYIAGTTDPTFEKLVDLYDLFIDVGTSTISVSPKSAEIIQMCKSQRELATFLFELSESDFDETRVKNEMSRAANSLLDRVRKLATTTPPGSSAKMVTMGDLKAQNLSPNVENLLFNLALSENIMML